MKKKADGKTAPAKKTPAISTKETVYRLWKKSPAKTLEQAEQLAEKHGVKVSTIKSWCSSWKRGQDPARQS